MYKLGIYLFIFLFLLRVALKNKFLRKKIIKLLELTGFICFANTSIPIKIEKISLKIKDLPNNLENLKVVQLSDFHFDSSTNKKLNEEIICLTESLEPDIIFLTGDYTNNNYSEFPLFLDLLKGIKCKYGVYAIAGNNDESYKQYLKENFKKFNITMLENEIVFPFGKNFPIIGLGELLQDKNKELVIKNCFDKYEKTPKIVILHDPELVTNLKSYRTDLILAGHTHGGSIRLPIIGSIYPFLKKIVSYRYFPEFLIEKLPYPKYFRKNRKYLQWIEGVYNFENKILNVSRGIGSNKNGIRIFCNPEINLITLKSK